MGNSEKSRRVFSDAFKREKVSMIENKEITVLQLSRLYEVSSTAIYKWRRKYGTQSRSERIVVEKESEGKKTEQLLFKLKEREQVIGSQQIEIRYLKEVIKYWSKDLGIDLEKKVERPL